MTMLGGSVRAQNFDLLTDAQLVTRFRELHADQKYEEALDVARRLAALRELTLGADNANTAWAVVNMGAMLINLGRHAEAEPLLKRGLSAFEATQPFDSKLILSALAMLERVYYFMRRHAEEEAVIKRQLAIKERTLGSKHDDVISLVSRLHTLALSAERNEEAEGYFRRLPSDQQSQIKEYNLMQKARIASSEKRWGDAVSDMRQVTHLLVQRHNAWKKPLQSSSGDKPGIDDQWRFFVKTAYRSSASGGADATVLAGEAFEAAQWLGLSMTSSSVAQMAVRARVSDPRFAALLRERQDLTAEWRIKKGKLDAVDTYKLFPEFEPPILSYEEARIDEKALRTRNASIEKRLADIDRQVAKDFAGQSIEADMSPIAVRELQGVLGADEAFVLFLSTDWVEKLPPETFVWVVTRSELKWFKSALEEGDLQVLGAKLYCGLNWRETCREKTGVHFTEADELEGKPLPFDVAAAHEIYQSLLAPAASLIQGKHLLVVGSDLPIHVLVTAEPGWRGWLTAWRYRPLPAWLARWLPNWSPDFGWLARRLPSWSLDFGWLTRRLPNWSFELGLRRWWFGYTDDAIAAARWLIRDHAVSAMPAVSSLMALRKNAKPSAAREPFIGYGNPALDGEPGCQSAPVAQKCPDEQIGSHSPTSRRRAAKFDVDESQLFLASGAVDGARLRKLCPLPDTALELSCIAKSIGASPKSLFVGQAMTEAALKKAPLDRYRVIHFATHGLKEGDVFRYVAPGRREPALVMTPPANLTEQDDGLLTASEIAALKLDADWVIMSACNTAGDRDGLHGLASAFFYAGARAVLATHWPVNSDAATMLTTQTFAALKRDPAIGRAEAFRRSMMALMGDPQRPWAAHPSYWAPFVLIGEGGSNR
jgi:CHAT domain-containing protein/tetratricopeptide (TPR) repeat protein